MVLQGKPCGRVGRRRIFVTHGPLSRSRLSGPCVVKPPAGHTVGPSLKLASRMRTSYAWTGPVVPCRPAKKGAPWPGRERRICLSAVSYTHLRAHETDSYLVCRL